MIQLSSDIWKSFWDVVPLSQTTINFIESPLIGTTSFLIPFYLFLISSAVLIFIVENLRHGDLQLGRSFKSTSHKRRSDLRTGPQGRRHHLLQTIVLSLMKTVILTCIAGGILFALRMDYGWYKLWEFDKEVLAPMSLDERIAFLEQARINLFAQWLRTNIPQNEQVRIITSNSYFRFVLKYYLLPVKSSENGNYIVVAGENYSFDPAKHTLLQDRNIVEQNLVLISLGREFIVCRKARVN